MYCTYRASYGGIKMKKFYNLLIDNNVNVDDLGTMLRENRKDVKEMRNEFRASRSFAVVYTLKALFKIIVSALYCFYIVSEAYGKIYECEGIDCRFLSYKNCSMDGVYNIYVV